MLQSDAIDINDVKIYSSPDVKAWPATARITSIEFRPDNFLVEFTKKEGPGRWPDAVTPGWDGPLQYTIWVILKVGGEYRSCGCIQIWYGKDGVRGPFSNGSKDWWMRIPEMASTQPRPGDTVYFFVAAGDCRLRTEPTSVRERSNIVKVLVPMNDTDTFTFAAEEPGPQPQPTPAPELTPGPDVLAQVLERLDRIEAKLTSYSASFGGISTFVKSELEGINAKLEQIRDVQGQSYIGPNRAIFKPKP